MILLGKVPEIPGYDRLCRGKALRVPFLTCPNIVAPPASQVLAVNDRLRAFAATIDGVDFFDPTPYVCPQGRCSVLDADGLPQYFDDKHLSFRGSMALARTILAQDGLPAAFAGIATPPSPRQSTLDEPARVTRPAAAAQSSAGRG